MTIALVAETPYLTGTHSHGFNRLYLFFLRYAVAVQYRHKTDRT